MGDPVKYYSPLEYRSVPGDMRANTLSPPNSKIFPHSNHVSRQQIIHTGAMQSQPVPTAEKVQSKNSDFSFNEFLRSMTRELPEEENQKLRATSLTDSSLKEHKSLSNLNGYPRQDYDSWTPQTFHESPSIYETPTSIEHQTSKALPKFNFLEPVTGRMSSKVNGLMGLVLTLLGSGSDNLVMKGFKEVIIDGILKPLMLAKGGIKVLISKMTIPLISLLLINVEVLITMWWLWDDCPQPQPSQPYYQSPSNYNYNAYNTTYR